MNRPPLTPYRPPRDAPDTPPVVARVIDESGDELQLRPVECPARHEIAPVVLPEMLAESETPAAGRVRFSVLDLLIVTAAISIGLAGGKWVPAGFFALFMGVVTVGGLIIVELYPPQSRAGWLAWTALVLAYLSAWLSALLVQT